MNEIISKISSYNIFNYLLPGSIFAFVCTKFTEYQFLSSDLIIDLFLYYFFGLIISRIGSLFLEPLLIKLGFIKYADYKKYLEAEKNDSKIELLVEQNNVYRTLTALVLSIFFIHLYSVISGFFQFFNDFYVAIIFLFALLLFAYKKQTSYIKIRIENSVKED